MTKLIVATKNKGKLVEFQRILSPLGLEVRSQIELCPDIDVDETGTTFAANARLKAQAIYNATGIITVADDSGLCVDALNGRPGVYSARYGGHGLTDAQRVTKLLEELAPIPKEKRTARFISAICCIGPGFVLECEGICQGSIGTTPLGDSGFGYDPIFMVEGGSYAQLSGAQKDAISHRGKALRLFFTQLEEKLK